MKTIRSLFNILAMGAALVTVPACGTTCDEDVDCEDEECLIEDNVSLCGPVPEGERTRRCTCYMEPNDGDAAADEIEPEAE